MPRSLRVHKQYTELMIAAMLHYLSCLTELPLIADLVYLYSTGATVRVKATTPYAFVNLIEFAAQTSAFQLSYKKYLADFNKLTKKAKYEAMRDSIATMRKYNLIVENYKKQKYHPSQECDFQIFVKYDPLLIENHHKILKRFFQVGGRWDKIAGVSYQRTQTKGEVTNQLEKLQQILGQLIDWNNQLFPDKLIEYTSDRSQLLASLVSLVEIAIEADALEVSDHSAKILLNLAKFYIAQSKLDQAYFLLEERCNLHLRIEETADSLHYFGIIYHKRGDLLLAEKYYQESLTLREKIGGENHPATADTTHTLAELYTDLQEYEKAEFWFNKSLQRQKIAYGQEHPFVTNTLNGIANLNYKLGKYNDAEKIYTQVISLASKQNAYAYLGTAWHGLGNIYVRQSRYSEAENYYSQSINLVTKEYGENHPNIAIHKAALAAVYQIQNKTIEAEELYKQSINLLIKNYGIYHPFVGEYLSDLAYLLLQKPDSHKIANAFFHKSLEILNKFYAVDDDRITNIYQGLKIISQLLD